MSKNADKPSLFIGSSQEGTAFAGAVRDALSEDAAVTVWNDGVFSLGQTFIEALLTALPRFDFAVLVLTPDDLVISREQQYAGPRDNLLFELGLFMGALGRSRTFVLHERSSFLKMPSDLAGLVTATYEWHQGQSTHRDAVEPACASIRSAVRDLGVADVKTGKAIGHLRTRLSKQEAQIRSLQVAFQGIVTQYELDKLLGLERDEPFLCYYSDDLYNELKRLRAMGLARHHEGTGLGSLRRQYKDRNATFDLKRYFYLTREGREYLQLRRELHVDEEEP